MAKDIYEKYIKNSNVSRDTKFVRNEQEMNMVQSQEVSDYLINSIETITKSIVDNIQGGMSNIKSTDNQIPRYDITICNGNIIIPGIGIVNGNIGISQGIISTITTDRINGKENIDAKGKYVSPGIIDPHVHLGLFAPFELEIETETRAAIAGGVTTIGCFIGGGESHLANFPKIEEQIREKSSVDIIPHLVIQNEMQLNEMQDYINLLDITSFKLYMNGMPGLIPDVDDGFFLDVFEEVKKAKKKCLVCVHTENTHMVKRATKALREELGGAATVYDWSKTHPEMAEEEAIIRLSYLAKKTQVDVYMVHMSSADGVKQMRNIRKDNKYIKAETTSPYLSIHNRITNSSTIKMEPPFRTPEDIEELWRAIEDDIIDTIGTDTVTMTAKEKNIGNDIWETIPGYPAVETHLPVLLNEGVAKRRIPIEKIIEKTTSGPAKLFGVYPKKGSMMIGSDADIIIIDLEASKNVEATHLYSRSDFSLYEGEKLKGWPITTIKSGKIIFKDGKFTTAKTQCNYLKR